jgi:N-dimethylarginine dimethylaminohydrolase
MRRVLMVSPDHFRVDYAINPYMRGPDGQLNKVDRDRALQQWGALRDTYRRLGLVVETLPGRPELPDMVFAANQSFPFPDPATGRPAVLMSHMRSAYRQPEVAYFREWYAAQGYAVHALHDAELCFEGNGDALGHPGLALVWGGYGPRTRPEVYGEISERFGLDVIRLSLECADYYHLDTCFAILDADTVAIQPRAFTAEARRMIAELFGRVIEIDDAECLQTFAGNCHCPNGKDVILQRGSRRFVETLERAGFTVHEVETSEFIKSGGSVFCLKMMLW